MLKVGCCGFPIRQEEYFEKFPAIEIQDTFYQPPPIETARRWRESAADDFTFTIRAWQLITHDAKSPTYRKLKQKVPTTRQSLYGWFRLTRETTDAWKTTRQIARALRAPVVIFHTTAGFEPTTLNLSNMRRFFSGIDREGLSCAWESSGRWQAADVRDVCNELDLIHVVDPFREKSVRSDPFYWRLSGLDRNDRPYAHAQLEQLARAAKGRTGYCLFNNASMLNDAEALMRILFP